MGPSEKSFNQVKAILGKLDRNIDQMRQRRLTPPTPAGVGADRMDQTIPTKQQTEAPAAPTRSGHKVYGRATPLPPRP